jgi:UDP-N-acetyl-D-glucosamine dehydrogenase
VKNKNKEKVGVIGLGYVGLPLAVVFAESGYDVIGFDINKNTCKLINQGKSHIKDIEGHKIKKITDCHKFIAVDDFSKLSECDVISICVPTPLNKIKDPDLSFVISASESIAKTLRKGQIIILESTTYPGTTKELVLPILEKNGLKVGVDFNLCFSPERVDPGNKVWHTKNTPKILGGISKSCVDAGVEIYSKVFKKIIPVENTEAAELVKVYENTFRMINIALANELSQICDKLNLNVWEIIDAAATKPFGFMKFTPGPGLGGHCIPLDPHYLSWKMRTLSFKTRMIDLASTINSEMPNNVVEKIGVKLNESSKSFKNAKILILGVAYKKDIDDLRESPSLEIIRQLQQRGAMITYHDPYCKIINEAFHQRDLNIRLSSIVLNKKAVKSADVVVITTDHTDVDYNLVFQNAIKIVDTRGIMRKYSEKK